MVREGLHGESVMNKKQRSIRLSEEAWAIVSRLGADLGLNDTAVMEVAVRSMAGKDAQKALAEAMAIVRPRGRPKKKGT